MLKIFKRFFLATGLLLSLVGCGGGGGGSSSNEESNLSEAPADILDSIDFLNQKVEILMAEGLVALTGLSSDKTTAVALLVPLESFYAGETVPLGADGLYGFNPQEGFVFVYEGLQVGKQTAKASKIYISLQGSVKWNEVSLASGGKISGTLEISKLAPIHQKTGLIPRGKKYSFALNKEFAAVTYAGSTRNPIIFGFSPRSGPLGTKVILKGQNFGGVTKVSLDGCYDLNSFPFEIISGGELHVTLDQPSCKSRSPLNVYSPNAGSIRTGDSFQFEIPFVKMLEMGASDPVILDSSRDLVLFRRKWWSEELMVYSFAEGRLAPSLYLDNSIHAMDTARDGASLLLFRSSEIASPRLFDLERIGLDNVLEMQDPIQIANTWGHSIYGNVFLGKGRKGFVEESWKLGFLDLNARRVDALPQALSTPFNDFDDSLLRSRNREYIIVNRLDRRFSHNPTVVYRSLDNGDFQKLSSVNINDAIFGIAEGAGEFWSETSIYNVNLENIGGYGADLTEWDETKVAGIVFDPQERYAILISKKGMLHIVDRVSRATLASNIRITPLKNPQIREGIFLSRDGTKIFLKGESQLYIVDLAGLLNSLGL